jgi:hypothetical protein
LEKREWSTSVLSPSQAAAKTRRAAVSAVVNPGMDVVPGAVKRIIVALKGVNDTTRILAAIRHP